MAVPDRVAMQTFHQPTNQPATQPRYRDMFHDMFAYQSGLSETGTGLSHDMFHGMSVFVFV